MLFDEAARHRFVEEIDRNFSVIAPAGVGKTHAIVHRLLALSKQSGKNAESPIAVLTYTRKAAEEMQMRVRQALTDGAIINESFLNRCFFGTIHSFALKLLQIYGSSLGFGTKLDFLEDEKASWIAFQRSTTIWESFKKEPLWPRLMSLLPAQRIWELGCSCRLIAESARFPERLPQVDLASIYAWEEKRSRLRPGQESAKMLLRDWEDKWHKGLVEELPVITTGGSDFIDAVNEVFSPLKDTIGQAILYMAVAISKEYRLFRLRQGKLLYDDMVPLALELLDHPKIWNEIQKKPFYIIIDEAQDLDANQLKLLGRLGGVDEGAIGQNNGRFVMVGDPQQAIYGMRADLPTYLKAHRSLISSGRGEELVFSVTFRCDKAIVDCVNRLFPSVLEEAKAHQVSFTPLHVRPCANKGLVSVWDFQKQQEGGDGIIAFARQFSQRLKKMDLAKLGVASLNDVACLCPRNDWLKVLANAFQEANIPYVLKTSHYKWGDEPLHNWLLALMAIVCRPDDAFEVAGVLREIFGISDGQIVQWVKRRINGAKKHPLSLPFLEKKGPKQDEEMRTALSKLTVVLQSVEGKSLRQSIEAIGRAIDLPGRVMAITPLEDRHKVEILWEQVLFEASQYECDEIGLEGLLAKWRLRLNQGMEAGKNRIGIQLMSMHAAKGLEWPVVFLPYFFRPIGIKKEAYPRVIYSFEDEPVVQLDAGHHSVFFQKENKLRQRAELERLLYVAATRAKQSLIITDDSAFFETSSNSLADLAGALGGGSNFLNWEALPRNALPGLPAIDVCVKDNGFSSTESNRLLSPVARWRAMLAIERKLPSAAVLSASQGIHAAAQPQELFDGTDYGNQWHQMMEQMPWAAGRVGWLAHWEQWKCRFFDQARATREWDLFLISKLASLLEGLKGTVRCEVPFFWQPNTEIVYEGTIDCVFASKDYQKQYVLDWKTHKEEKLEELAKRYEPQLLIYKKALEAATNSAFLPLIYSTAHGKTLAFRGTGFWAIQ